MKKDIMDMDPKKLPDVMAFQDEFTRGFMKSTKEVEDGYYLFESGTGGYTMLYPEDARINNVNYELIENRIEHIIFGGDDEKVTGETYTIYASYNSGEITKDPELLLHLLSTPIHYKGDYDKVEYDDRTIYFATIEDITGENKSNTYILFGVIQSKDSDQAVSYTYTLFCEDEEKDCTYDIEAIENEVKKIMESIEFKVE